MEDKNKEFTLDDIKSIWEGTLQGHEAAEETIKHDTWEGTKKTFIPKIKVSSTMEANKGIVTGRIENPNNTKTVVEEEDEIQTISEAEAEVEVEVDDRTEVVLDNEEVQGIFSKDATLEETFVIGHENEIDDCAFSDFVLIDELGRGGMGVVYLAHQNSLKRDIALKSITSNAIGEQVKARFISEAMVTAELDHPNIIPVHALACDENGVFYMAMKRVVGFSWQELLHPKTEEQKKEADKYTTLKHLEIFQKVCDAMSFAHAHNVVHRDLKPSNIMIGHFGEVLVMDWGIAVDVSEKPPKDPKLEHKTQIQNPAGTPQYMAPEMAVGDSSKIGFASDIYLLGSILYEIITGVAPHQGSSVLKIIYNISKNDFPPPSKRNPDANISSDLEKIVLKAMAKEPENRYGSIQELKQAVREYLEHYESLLITQKAWEKLEELEKKQKANMLVIPDTYLDCNNLFNSFEKALEVWPENETAYQGAVEAGKIQINWALYHGDIPVAEMQLKRFYNLTPVPKNVIAELKPKIRVHKKSRLKTIIGCCFAVIFLISLIVGMTLWQEKKQKENREYERKSKIKEAKNDLRESKKTSHVDKILEVAKNARELRDKKLSSMVNKALKQEVENALQNGDYKKATRLLIAGMKFNRPQGLSVSLTRKEKTQLFLNVPEDLRINIVKQYTSEKICQLLFLYAEKGWLSGEMLGTLWNKYTNYLIKKSKDSKVKTTNFYKKLVTVTLLALSSEAYYKAAKMDESQQQQKKAFEIPLAFPLWEMLVKSNIKKKDLNEKIQKKLDYAKKSPWTINRNNGKIWAFNIRNKNIWSFPDATREFDYFTCSNFLIIPERQIIYVGYGIALIGIDISTGHIVERYNVGKEVFYLRYLKNNKLELELVSQHHGYIDHYITFDLTSKKLEKVFLPDTGIKFQVQKFFEAKVSAQKYGIKNFFLPNQEKKKQDVSQFLNIAKKLQVLDKTNEAYLFLEALALLKSNRKEEANGLYNTILKQNLNIYETVVIAFICDIYEVKSWAEKAYQKAEQIQVTTFRNPDISSSFITSPALFMRSYGGRLFQIGRKEKTEEKIKRSLDILAQTHKYSTYLEGDYMIYSSLERWAEKNMPKKKALFQKKALEAISNGGGILLSSVNITFIVDYLIFLISILSVVIAAMIFYFWLKYRLARIKDLASLGHYNIVSRNFAFISKPIRRISYTFILYMTRAERAALLIFMIVFFGSIFTMLTYMKSVTKAVTMPISFGNGYAGNYSTVNYLRKTGALVNQTSKKLLLAEGAYQKRSIKEAIQLWKDVDHPIALNNIACLSFQKEKEKALMLLEKAKKIAREEIHKEIIQINQKIIVGEKIKLKDIPNRYRAFGKYFPGKPILLQCGYYQLYSVLSLTKTDFLKNIADIIFSRGGMYFLHDLNSVLPTPIIVLFINDTMRFFFLFLLALLFVSLLARVRPSKFQKKDRLWKKVFLSILKFFSYFMPGVLFIVRKKTFSGFFLLLLTIFCYSSVLIFINNGGILSSIAMPTFPYFTGDIFLSRNQILMGWFSIAFLIFIHIIYWRTLYLNYSEE